MIQRITITGYRAFRKMELNGLTALNLIVGANNSGKTSVLDAIDLLVQRQSPEALFRAADRRSEAAFFEGGPETSGVDQAAIIDLRTVFHGRKIERESQFRIESDDGAFVDASVSGDVVPSPSLTLANGREVMSMPIERDVYATYSLHRFRDRSGRTWHGELFEEDSTPVRFVGTHARALDQIVSNWGGVVLTESEDAVVTALREIEPRLKRIAYIGEQFHRDPGGFFVTLEGVANRVPLGNLGDGMKHLLALTVNAASARGGILFVDEIETGLHYRAMGSLWKTLHAVALQNNVQVFATTHSSDCAYALGGLPSSSLADVSLHRIETGRDTSIRYSGEEISAAAREIMELR